MTATAVDFANAIKAKYSLKTETEDDALLALAPAVDQPTVTVTSMWPWDTISPTMGTTLVREKRVGDVTTADADLAGDTHFRLKGCPRLMPESSGNLQASFVTPDYHPNTFLQWTYCIETWGFGTAVAFKLRNPTADVHYRLKVNGRFVSDGSRVLTMTGGTTYEVKFTFPSAAPRRIEFWSQTAFGGGWSDIGSLVRPPTPISKRVAVIGDSFTAGSAGIGLFDTYALTLAHLIGADEPILVGQGGTGWLNAGPLTTFDGRTSIVASMSPHAVVFLGSPNDSWADLPGLQTAVQTTVEHLSSVPRVFVSGYLRDGNSPAQVRVKDGTVAAGRTFLDLMGLIFGTGNTGAPTKDGNADVMIEADNVHPSRYGHSVIARALASAIRESCRWC